jgi:hypothetical protein
MEAAPSTASWTARRTWRSRIAAAALVALPLAAVGALVWPMLFTHSYFVEDWLEQVWLIWQQSIAIEANHLPSLFLDYHFGVFYPHYAFYGGTLYAVVGSLSLLLGGAPVATYVLTYILGFAAAYGGWYWTARMWGLGRWAAQAPGLVFITSPYYLTLIYGRGDWPEFIAISTIPLVIAAGLSVLRAERLRLWPALALAGGCIGLFGSHNLTLVWGSTLLALAALAIVLFIPTARRGVTRSGLIRVAALVVPALLVNAWVLLPTLAYGSHTAIGSEYQYWRAGLRETMYLVSAGHLFTLSRASVANASPDFVLSLPILAIAWVLASVAVFTATDRRGPWFRVLLIAAGLGALIAVVMTHVGLLLALPQLYATLQFSYRLESYVLLGLSGAVLAALVIVRGRGRHARIWTWTLAVILLVSGVGAIQQVDAYPHTEARAGALDKFETLRSEVPLIDYLDLQLPRLNYNGPAHTKPPMVDFRPSAARKEHASVMTRLLPGQLAYSNLQGGPNLVHVSGAKIVGIDSEGGDVIEIDGPRAPAGGATGHARREPVAPETITLSPADPLPVVLGRVLSVLGVGLLVLEFVVVALMRRRRAA